MQLLSDVVGQADTFFPIEPLCAFMVDDGAFGAQHIMEHGAAPTRMFGRQLLESVTLGRVVFGLGLVLQAGTVPAGEAAGATLGQPKALDSGSHGGAASFGR